ncbi:MAG: extracellular solute-binding protein [Candidatus Bipolaricaulis sp.]|nr:extracellular solute-binding protein [Candidatus Bipolaricaulis sp.]
MSVRSTKLARGLWVLLAVSLGLSIAAYAPGGKLVVMVWDTEQMDDLFRVVAEFAQQYLVSVELYSVPFSDYRAKLTERLQGGEPPDLFWATTELLQELAGLGLVIPLDDAVRDADGFLASPRYVLSNRQLGLQVGPTAPFSDSAYAVSPSGEPDVKLALLFVDFVRQRWTAVCCATIVQPNPALNTAISAHGNTDWHIDTANEFLFGTDMNGASTASNHCPDSWTRTHMHVGLTNTNVFYYDRDRIATGQDTDATSGIDTAMLFFYAGHGFSPDSWSALGSSADVTNVSIADDPGWGMLRYYWQCSCTIFAHGPACCSGDSCSDTSPCTPGKDWWYQCPGEFDGSADSLAKPNVYERWGAAINPNLRMACGVSTCAYCHEGEMNRIWNNYNNLGYDVADSFIDGLRSGAALPLCITMGGYSANATPLVQDTTFTNLPNTSGTSHLHIQYLSNFQSSRISDTLRVRLPELLPKIVYVIPRPIPDPWWNYRYRYEKEWMYSIDEIEGRGPQIRINQLSGAMYIAGPAKPAGEPPLLSEEAYFDMASRHVRELGWLEEHTSRPTGIRMMIASVPREKPAEQEHVQKNVIVTLSRLVDVEGISVPVLGEGGKIEVQMNNDGSLLNASKVWREIAALGPWEKVKSYEEALAEAMAQIKEQRAYEVDDWEWGYVEEAGNEGQEAMHLVFRFWLLPATGEDVREAPPLMIEVPA